MVNMSLPGDVNNVQASANGGAQVNTATLAAVAGQTNVLDGMLIIVGGATAGTSVNATSAGLKGGDITVPVESQTGAVANPQVIQITFPTPIPATGQNVAISVTLPSLGVGNATAGVTLFGHRV
jgi:hypothetical protein